MFLNIILYPVQRNKRQDGEEEMDCEELLDGEFYY